MRLCSNRESIRRHEPTLLAILESTAAMAGSVWIGVHFGTWKHVLVGCCVAPLLLLRTDRSCDRAILWFNRVGSVTNRNVLLDVIWATVGGVMVRIASTFVECLNHPLACIRAIPTNWWRSVWATDLATSPEYMPTPDRASPELTKSIEDVKYNFRSLNETYSTWRDLVETLGDAAEGPLWKRAIVLLAKIALLLPIALLLTLSALAYRFSVKATAIGWFPLSWALKPVKAKGDSWEKALLIDRERQIPQVVALWSGSWIVLAGVKYMCWALRFELASRVDAWRVMFDEWAKAGGWKAKIALSPAADALANFVRPGQVTL